MEEGGGNDDGDGDDVMVSMMTASWCVSNICSVYVQGCTVLFDGKVISNYCENVLPSVGLSPQGI